MPSICEGLVLFVHVGSIDIHNSSTSINGFMDSILRNVIYRSLTHVNNLYM